MTEENLCPDCEKCGCGMYNTDDHNVFKCPDCGNVHDEYATKCEYIIDNL